MANAQTIARIEKIIWALIFAGLLIGTLGIATHSRSPATGWSLGVFGGALVLAGIVLIWIRSRMKETE